MTSSLWGRRVNGGDWSLRPWIPSPANACWTWRRGREPAASLSFASVPRWFPCDFSLGMLQVGPQTPAASAVHYGDAMTLPFADASFDAVTISFGLRNIHDPAQGLREMRRVTRQRGGRLVVCEFSTPVWPPFRTIYQEYLMRPCPRSPNGWPAT